MPSKSYARSIPLVKSCSTNTGEVPAFPTNLWTNHLKFRWNTHSPLIPFAWSIAFRRDFVVADCQPPSNKLTEFCRTWAIQLPWRNTKDTPSKNWTSVLPDFQLRQSRIASTIWRSILRIGGVAWFTLKVYRVRRGIGVPLVPLMRLAHQLPILTNLEQLPHHRVLQSHEQ